MIITHYFSQYKIQESTQVVMQLLKTHERKGFLPFGRSPYTKMYSVMPAQYLFTAADALTPQLIKYSWKTSGSQTVIAASELHYFQTFVPPSDTTKNITRFSHCWEGFILKAETANPSEINGKPAISVLSPQPRLLDPATGSGRCKLSCYCSSETRFACNEESLIVAPNQNTRAAVSSRSNYTLT